MIKQRIKNGIIDENPLFVSLLGLCPALATTTSVEAALGMGILFSFVLIGSNIFISLIRKIISEEIKIPVYIVIIASFATIIKILTEAFLPYLYNTLGVFISLIVVNCIIFGRAEAFASKNNVKDTFFDSLGVGIGFLMALLIIAFFRELLGTGGVTIGEIFTFLPKFSFLPFESFRIKLFILPPGGFLTLGIILMILSIKKNKKKVNS